MLIRIFKSGHLIHLISIIIIAVVLWIPSLFESHNISSNNIDAPLYQLFYSITGTNHIIQSLISLVIIILTAIILNSIVTESGISSKTSMLGFFFFVFFVFSNTDYIISNRFLIVNLLIILALKEIFLIAKTDFTLAPLYNAALLFGMSAMFYFPILIMILFIWAVLLVLRINKWRDYVVALIGISLPLLFILSWYYFTDKSDIFIENITSLVNIHFQFFDISFFNLLILMLLAGILIPAFFFQINTLYEKNIALRQKLTINIWLFVFMIIVILLDINSTEPLILLAIPSSIFLSNLSFNIKKLKWVDIYVSSLFILILINQYLRFFDA